MTIAAADLPAGVRRPTDARHVLDRVNAYRDKIDARLAELPNDYERRRFLDERAAFWREAYFAYQERVAAGTYNGTVTAWDFAITMSDIETRRLRYPAC